MQETFNAVRRRKGFTLVEGLVGIVLLSIGIVATIRGIGAIQLSDLRVKEKSRMITLASQKLDELVATSDSTNTNAQTGDFQDQFETKYTWKSEIATTSLTNLNAITITVERTDGFVQPVEVSATVFQPPAATAAGGTP